MNPNDLTAILRRVEAGESAAAPLLLEAIYDELRSLARAQMNAERPGHTLEATALVHEAYLKLVRQTDAGWKDRAHFFASAAIAMRRILIDHARARLREKRGGGVSRAALDPERLAQGMELDDIELVSLGEALDELEQTDPLGARLVAMRYFADMEIEQIAAVEGIADRTVRRRWNLARARLFHRLTGAPPE
ncbi:MAG: ECF-type sigma factor [Phycisphaerales bacterium]